MRLGLRPQGRPVLPGGPDEVTGALSMIRGQRPGSTAVLARTNGALAPHIKACLKAGIPVSVPGGAEGFLKDVEALLSRPAMQKAPRAHGMHGCGLKKDTLRPSRILARLDEVEAHDLTIALKAHGNDPQAAAADNDYRDRILLIDLTRILVAAFEDVAPKGKNSYGQPCEKAADAKTLIAWSRRTSSWKRRQRRRCADRGFDRGRSLQHRPPLQGSQYDLPSSLRRRRGERGRKKSTSLFMKGLGMQAPWPPLRNATWLTSLGPAPGDDHARSR